MMQEPEEATSSSSPPSTRAFPPPTLPEETFTERVRQKPDPRPCVSPSSLSKLPHTTVVFLDIQWKTLDRTRATIF